MDLKTGTVGSLCISVLCVLLHPKQPGNDCSFTCWSWRVSWRGGGWLQHIQGSSFYHIKPVLAGAIVEAPPCHLISVLKTGYLCKEVSGSFLRRAFTEPTAVLAPAWLSIGLLLSLLCFMMMIITS